MRILFSLGHHLHHHHHHPSSFGVISFCCLVGFVCFIYWYYCSLVFLLLVCSVPCFSSISSVSPCICTFLFIFFRLLLWTSNNWLQFVLMWVTNTVNTIFMLYDCFCDHFAFLNFSSMMMESYWRKNIYFLSPLQRSRLRVLCLLCHRLYQKKNDFTKGKHNLFTKRMIMLHKMLTSNQF